MKRINNQYHLVGNGTELNGDRQTDRKVIGSRLSNQPPMLIND